MSERLNKCPLCKSGHFLNDREIIDLAVSKETFVLCKCSQCQLLFTNPRPNQDEIAPYYEFPEYYSHQDSNSTLTEKIYNQVRNINIQKKIKLIESLIPKGSILDFGCGTGTLLAALKTKGWSINGIELNKKARKKASEITQEKIVKTLDDLELNSKVDIITLFHVLEHVHELRKTIKNLKKSLNKNGYLLFAVPNHQSYEAKKYQGYWAGWDVPRHLYHFSQESMEKLADEFNFTILQVKPMIFDSYYVSLLSEKYKNPNGNIIANYAKALKTGWKSNQKAKATNEFSSLLYILKKK
ncbi:class I SAM-dependent methyltransferase [Algoriphagus hitonicola]|uniref:2-polyprenyl-3-methyl-5-hydroxy-6-metoxy-1,4-benzoquinol methylase n=1 Tax=Algoriphagus hitonicola TaxID=435880 RepID=A0A1I2SP81_9BACT|nr:class I SAM-dependent methyltransferase [Algoriphagus hitonicola]SFG51986.1 2-polyprenyl-3-methyl-5-hydroxy-6-metoxy-1,4-benzoquinol methylase [Algoriphagus hitonicola]